jgi:XRE family transcriptional regulator, regulator of sulfur utilization
LEPLKQLGLNIKVLRTKKGLAQDRLAAAAGIDRSYMGMIERGESAATIITLLKLAKALECTIAEMTDGMVIPDGDC